MYTLVRCFLYDTGGRGSNLFKMSQYMYVRVIKNSFESILNCRRRARSLANGTDEDSMEIESPQPASASKRGRGRRK